jgi:hydrogenase nickel incorporation protein HypA/HybF
MHESSLAKRIVDEVIARSGGRTVRRVLGRIAEDEALSREALELHFRAHARGTIAASAELAFTLRHLSARCKACNTLFMPDHHVQLCPACGSMDAELDGEPGVFIESILVEEP